MNCDQVQEKLSEYLENALGEEEQNGLTTHLALCTQCRADAEALRRAIRSVSSLPSVDPPPGLSTKIMAKIREDAERPGLWRRLFPSMPMKVPLHAAAILIIGGIAVYLYQAIRPLGSVAPESGPSRSASAPARVSPPAEERAPAARPKARDNFRASPKQPAAPPAAAPSEGKAGNLADKNIGAIIPDGKKKAEGPAPAGRALLEAQVATPTEVSLFVESGIAQGDEKDNASLVKRIEDLVLRSGGRIIHPGESEQQTDRTLFKPSNMIWATLPEDHYDRFKADLTSFAKVSSEVRNRPAQTSPTAPVSSPIHIQMVLTPKETPEKTVP